MRKPRVKRPTEKDLPKGYDSKWEYNLHQSILKYWEHHKGLIEYSIPHKYHPDFIKIITTHDPDNLNIVHVITAIRNDHHETSSEVGGRRKKRKTVKKRKSRKTVKNKKKKRTKKSVKNKKRATRKRT